ncbi:MAG: nickel-dependent lactate racemase [Anaerolineae bacterium]|nr:nickel-dependent lactate racemase [Anaerolineae bacterium]
MAEYSLGYGTGTITFMLPDGCHVDVITAKEVSGVTDPVARVEQALDNPVGEVTLESFRGAKSAAIAVNDKTRPVPHAHLLPPLLARLEALGLAPERITLVIATGTHAPMPPEEFARVIPPEVLARYPVVSHDCDDPDSLVYLGETSRGTPVWTNRLYMQADLRLVVGNIEPHMFMGFSGGAKSASIGLGGRETISHNHKMLTQPGARMACYDENPLRMDVEEIGALIGVHFTLNAVLNGHKEIVKVVAGEPRAVMVAGIPLVRELAVTPVSAPYDLVIASPGGAPKDINLYQAQKSLVPAAMVTRTGGTVILVAACAEGIGSAAFERFMGDGQVSSMQAVLARFEHEEFQIGKHKGFLVARDAVRVNVKLASEMPRETVERLLLTPAESLQAAVDEALAALPADARVAVMPAAGAVVPVVESPEAV